MSGRVHHKNMRSSLSMSTKERNKTRSSSIAGGDMDIRKGPVMRSSISVSKMHRTKATDNSVSTAMKGTVDETKPQKSEFKDETTTSWKIIMKPRRVKKLKFQLDRSCNVKKDLRAKKNVLLTELRKVPGLIIDDLVHYYYKPYKHELITDDEDRDLYEKMKTVQMDEKRTKLYGKVIDELIQTEASYISGLNILQNVYLKPLSSNKKHKKEIELISSQILTCIELHTSLLDKLNTEVKKNPQCPLIGTIICEFSPSLEREAKYIFGYPTYLNTLSEMMADSSNVSLTKKAANEYKKSDPDVYIQGFIQYLIVVCYTL